MQFSVTSFCCARWSHGPYPLGPCKCLCRDIKLPSRRQLCSCELHTAWVENKWHSVIRQVKSFSVIAFVSARRGMGSNPVWGNIFSSMSDIGMNSDLDIGILPISEHFRYRNDVFQSDIFVSDIGITDVGCHISPTLRSMSMPTYGN